MKTRLEARDEKLKKKFIRQQLKREIARKLNPPQKRHLDARDFGLEKWEGEI